MPDEWATAAVTMVFKKGDPASCENYRPICLIIVAEKLMASMMKQRLLDAGVDALLWEQQFSCREKRSTEDAIFIARRRIELARAQRSGGVTLGALDRAKAFDSISTVGLLDALRRFGIPQHFLSMVTALVKHRLFYVRDCGEQSQPRQQKSGISQGCTLSPLFFVIVMSVLLHDSVGSLDGVSKSAYEKGALTDVVFADDTLLIGVRDEHVSFYLKAIADSGKRYGMELHWGKFQVLPIQCSPVIPAMDGNTLPLKHRLEYLGTVLGDDVHDSHELVRRIAMSKADFLALSCIWRRSSLTWSRKLVVFSALVESRLLYGISSLWLTVAQKRQLNGFQNRCVWSIIGVKPTFYSRVSNVEVLSRDGHKQATDLLLKRQLQMLGRVLRSSEGQPLRTCSFTPGTNWPAAQFYIRRVGRPCAEWIPKMMECATAMFGGEAEVAELTQCPKVWNAAINMYSSH